MATKSKKKAPPAKKPAAAKKKPATAKKPTMAKAAAAAVSAVVAVVDDGVQRALDAARADLARLTDALQAAHAERDRARGQTGEMEKLRSETLKGSVDLAAATRKADEAGRRADEASRRADDAGRRAADSERDRARLMQELQAARGELGGYKLRCPKCGKNFVEEDYEGITIDRCTGCDAIYFDAGEVDQLIAKVHEKMTSPTADAQQTSGWFKKLFKRKPKAGEPTGGESSVPPA
jgi:Zn-finger nucleic acid-binding protein